MDNVCNVKKKKKVQCALTQKGDLILFDRDNLDATDPAARGGKGRFGGHQYV